MASSGNQDIQPEPTGTILKDSLAAESLESGGSFAADNPHAGISSQTARGTTTNNTDTSGAYRLDPAADAEAREAAEGWTEEGQLKAGKNLSSSDSTTQQKQQQQSSGKADEDSAQDEAKNNDDDSTATTGSSYAAAASGGAAEREQDSGAKGDGGFGGDEQNASFTSDIGDENDPGRLAEQKYQTTGARSGADAGTSGPQQTEVADDGQYDALGGDTEA